MSDTAKIDVRIVSPDGILWEGKAASAILPAVDGEVGIEADHAPFLAMLGTGEARIETPDGTKYFALFGGFLEVVDNHVQVIVGKAESPDTIDMDAAQASLAKLDSEARRDYENFEAELEERIASLTRLRVAGRQEKK